MWARFLRAEIRLAQAPRNENAPREHAPREHAPREHAPRESSWHARSSSASACSSPFRGRAGLAQAQTRLWFVNAGGERFNPLYASPSQMPDWRPDSLGAGRLPPGQRVLVTPNFADCGLDVRAVQASGRQGPRMRVNAGGLSQIVFGGAGATVAPPGAGAGAAVTPGPPQTVAPAQGNPSFPFVNALGKQISAISAPLSGRSTLGPDGLGANVPPPGRSLAIPPPRGGGCLTDIRVVCASGRAAERRWIEACAIAGLSWR